MKRLKKWLARMMGGGKRQRRYVMDVQKTMMVHNSQEVCAFLEAHTPVITAAQYNKLPDECKKLFIAVGGKK